MGLGLGGLNDDMVLQNSCSKAGSQELIGILAGLGVASDGSGSALLRWAIAPSHCRHEVTEDRPRCQEDSAMT